MLVFILNSGECGAAEDRNGLCGCRLERGKPLWVGLCVKARVAPIMLWNLIIKKTLLLTPAQLIQSRINKKNKGQP